MKQSFLKTFCSVNRFYIADGFSVSVSSSPEFFTYRTLFSYIFQFLMEQKQNMSILIRLHVDSLPYFQQTCKYCVLYNLFLPIFAHLK